MNRRVEFPPAGARVRIPPADVARAWAQSSPIPVQYALGTARHESDFTANEVDTEPSGFVSYGIFQLSAEEASSASAHVDDLMTLAGSTLVLAHVADRRLLAICQEARLRGEDPAGPLPNDVWAYLALAHNQGLAACLRSIKKYGMDWAAYRARNSRLAGMLAYGDDCMGVTR